VIQTYQAGANTYIPKPAEYPRYREVISTLRTYWLDTALRMPKALHRSASGTSAPNGSSP
jgi:chemotaxis family two-component system response regulator Rcp1